MKGVLEPSVSTLMVGASAADIKLTDRLFVE